ncbi:MAG: aminoacyl-tRNA hydrolase [Candidatus Obscuribacterales bacterium]|nr:aminoacyl-tRNA hydrolase [Candidatus Obscuribacterales bacterium]
MRNLTIIGLGNPEPRFEWSRHQAGFMVVDEVAAAHGATFSYHPESKAYIATLPGDIRLIKPWTGMNESGFTVEAVMRALPLTSLLLVYDDINVAFGAMKYTLAANPDRHNGVINVHEKLLTNNFSALRLGLGPKPSGDKYDFVTAPVPADMRQNYTRCVKAAADSVSVWCEFGHSRAANNFNGRKLLA